MGFAAETENVVENARAKRAAKGCDWILANDVSPATGTFGGDANIRAAWASDHDILVSQQGGRIETFQPIWRDVRVHYKK